MTALFVHPMTIAPWAVLPLLLPLLLAVCIVYKTLRVPQLNMLIKQTVRVFLYLVIGVSALGGALVLLMKIFI